LAGRKFVRFIYGQTSENLVGGRPESAALPMAVTMSGLTACNATDK
jgi:hypothetical protein